MESVCKIYVKWSYSSSWKALDISLSTCILMRMPLTEKNISKPVLEVSCAIIEKNGFVLAAQRERSGSMGGFWEFPGGKIESGESAQDCLIRELEEELGVQIQIEEPMEPVSTQESSRIIRLHPFRCTFSTQFPIPREHVQILWLHHSRLKTLNWAPADLPVLANYLDILAENG